MSDKNWRTDKWHVQDEKTGKLTGGYLNGDGFSIVWKDTTHIKGDGTTVSELLLVLIYRLRCLSCLDRNRNTSIAITDMENAFLRLKDNSQLKNLEFEKS